MQHHVTLFAVKVPFVQYNLYYPTLLAEEQLVRIIEGSDNRRTKITGLNGVGRVGLRPDN